VKQTHFSDEIIKTVIQWAEDLDPIRAVLLTSTRAIPSAPVDIFSDYDIVLIVKDIRPFYDDWTWLQNFGQVLVVYSDPIQPVADYGIEVFIDVTQYQDGLKIDFSLWPVELLQKIAVDPVLPAYLDIGYTVLLDKDQLTEGLTAPTYRAYIPTPPTEQTYQTVIENFLSDAPYVAKNLWRDELMPAKYSLDTVMKHKYLRQMLEWRMEIDHNWSMKPGAEGKGLKKGLPSLIWAELESTYVGAGTEENWEALFKTIDLFRKVAIEVGDSLEFIYPQDLHQRIMDYLYRVKQLDPQAKSFRDLL
jgi:aminoglycoside 6-adenylyltransferase